MAYNELIADFELMREYVRQYYAFGTRSRSDYAEENEVKKAHDLVIRRLNSWLRPYLSYYLNKDKERVYYFAVDGRSVLQNPLFRAYQSKSVKTLRTQLFFYSMAVLPDTKFLPVSDIKQRIEHLHDTAAGVLDDKQSNRLCGEFEFDADSLRDTLEDEVALGIIERRKQGRILQYRMGPAPLPLKPLQEAVFFASEQTPMGVIGSFLLRQTEAVPEHIRFRHHYFVNALDDAVMHQLVEAMHARRAVLITTDPDRTHPLSVWPLRIYIGTQNGRQHLLCYEEKTNSPQFIRLSRIHAVKPLQNSRICPLSEGALREFESSVWGVGYSPLRSRCRAHVEMILRVEPHEWFIVRRLHREKRCAQVEQLSETQWKVTADVYSPLDMMPWIRSFTGRIERLSCTDEEITRHFSKGLAALQALYDGVGEPALTEPQKQRHIAQRMASKQASPLFHEIYGNYYGAIAAILRFMQDRSVTKNELNGLFRQDGILKSVFEDGKLNLVNQMEQDWKLLIWDASAKRYHTPITALPPFPLTTLELRWMRAAFSDPRVSLFLPENGFDALSGVEPLYDPDMFVYYDRYAEGDPFNSPRYRRNFRRILRAIREHRRLGIAFLSTNTGKERYSVICPYEIEYSEKEDRFRLITRKAGKPPMQINLDSILYCEDKGPFTPIQGDDPSLAEQEMELTLFDDHNALERVLLHFSDLKKRTRQLDERKYELTLWYRAGEEKEMIMRILSFGPYVRVQSPAAIAEEIKIRLQKQIALLTPGQQ